MNNHTLLKFDEVTAAYRIDPVLKSINWHWQHPEQWALLGGNGAGKSALAHIITDELRPQRGRIQLQPDLDRSQDIIHLSFELQRKLIDHDIRFDDSNTREDASDVGTTVRQIVLQKQVERDDFNAIASQCGIAHILDRGIRFVSTGESRKTLLARALYAKPKLLILDNPYEGLDRQSQIELGQLIEQLLLSPLRLLLLINQTEELPQNVSHVALLNSGLIETQGKRAAVLKYLEQQRRDGASHSESDTKRLPPAPKRSYTVSREKPLLVLKNVNVSYNKQAILSDINWQFDWGQHCCISGPNGAGKSTLLSLICGDNHKAYGQSIDLFGRRRGSGESIWEIKEKFGVVSTAMQLNHIGRLRVSEVVASGLYDTVGLYKNCSGKDRAIALEWLRVVELEQIAHSVYKQLSFGQQRLAMLARAMVKSPLILILDEPCLGLDEHHRHHILALVDRIAERGDCHILYVSHTPDEIPSCINQHLKLFELPGGGYTAELKN
jgi:molybdate transport system ATP-binding protein